MSVILLDESKKSQEVLQSFVAALEISEAKHADLIARMTAQLRELNTVKQEAQRETSELKKKLQVRKESKKKQVNKISST